MKKLMIFIAVLIPFITLAQKSPVDKLFEKYANKDGFTTVNISGKLLGLASKMDSNNKDATTDMFSKLTGIRILSVDDEQLNKGLDFYKELEKEGFFKDNKFESLMDVTEKDEVVRFMSKENSSGKITDLLLVVGGKSNALISISGLIDPENVAKITKSLDIEVGNDKGDKSKK